VTRNLSEDWIEIVFPKILISKKLIEFEFHLRLLFIIISLKVLKQNKTLLLELL
jgi:hypothetical protein